MVEWANPFHSLAVLFPVFAISPSKRPVACVQISPFLRKKMGEEIFSVDFFLREGDVSTQVKGLQWLVSFIWVKNPRTRPETQSAHR